MRIEDVRYPKEPSSIINAMEWADRFDDLRRYVLLACEMGYWEQAQAYLNRQEEFIAHNIQEFNNLLENPSGEPDEPEGLEAIRAQRPIADRPVPTSLPPDYTSRFLGSFLGRGAGCTLGAGLEFQSVENMEKWAREFGIAYPLVDYWPHVKHPDQARYLVGNTLQLSRKGMDCMPVDDDTLYTILGLLTLEAYGPGFTHRDMAELWKREIALTSEENGSNGLYWGERKFLQNILAGVAPERAGFLNNPNVQSVAAWTRADAYGYAAPGWPEKAAELAWRDASVNHRRSGVYGSMFIAAAVSAGFLVADPVKALHIALNELPQNSMFAQAMAWALDIAPRVKNYRDAVRLVEERYSGMFEGHAINNALYVVLGICIGGRDFTRVIGETVAMGFDNDCTGATSGSIVGAVIGKENLPPHWYELFGNRVQCAFRSQHAYISVDEIERRFHKQAERILNDS